MHEAFPGREQDLVGDEPDCDDHEHDTDYLVHGTELAAIVQQMAEAEPGQDGDIDFCRHQRAPGEGPALLEAADQKRQRGGQVSYGCREDPPMTSTSQFFQDTTMPQTPCLLAAASRYCRLVSRFRSLRSASVMSISL
jgi:hypothetical protein